MRATFFWSALSTMLSVSRWRLRLVVFEVRMWRLNACPRLNLPVPVFLKRLAAPLCVLSFGIAVCLVYNKIAARGLPTHLPTRCHIALCARFLLAIFGLRLPAPGCFRFCPWHRFLAGHAQRLLQRILQHCFFRRRNHPGELLRPLG